MSSKDGKATASKKGGSSTKDASTEKKSKKSKKGRDAVPPTKMSSSAMAIAAAKEEKRRKKQEAAAMPVGPSTFAKVRGQAAKTMVESSTGKWALEVVEQQGETGVEIAENVREAAERQRLYIESQRTKEELQAAALLKLQSRFNHGLPISDLGSGELQDTVRLGLNNKLTKLLSHKADPNEIDKRTGYTPLMVAAKNGNKAATQILLDAGADVRYQSRRGMTALGFAAKHGFSAIARIILDRAYECRQVGTLLELRDTDGRTARDHALGRGQTQLLAKMESALVAEQKVKVVEDNLNHIHKNIEDVYTSHGYRNGSTALHWLLENGSATFFTAYSKNQAIDSIKKLVKHGANYNDRDSVGRVPLHYAAMADVQPNLPCVRALLRSIKDLDPDNEDAVVPLEVDALDNGGMTPMLYAVERGAVSFCETLRRAGADIHFVQKPSGFTYLHFAAQRNFGEGADQSVGEVAQWLIDNEIDVYALDSYGRTAEDIAVETAGRDSRLVKVISKHKDELRLRDYRVKAIMAGQGLL